MLKTKNFIKSLAKLIPSETMPKHRRNTERRGLDLLDENQAQFRKKLCRTLQTRTSLTPAKLITQLTTSMPRNSDWSTVMQMVTLEADDTTYQALQNAFWHAPAEESRFADYAWVAHTWNFQYPWTAFSPKVLPQLRPWLTGRGRAMALKIMTLVDNQYVPAETLALPCRLPNPDPAFWAFLKAHLAESPETTMVVSGSYVLRYTSQADWKANDVDIYVYDPAPDQLLAKLDTHSEWSVEAVKQSRCVRTVVTPHRQFQLIFVDSRTPVRLINGFDFMVLQQYYDVRTDELKVRPGAAWEMTTRELKILEMRTTYQGRIDRYTARGYKFVSAHEPVTKNEPLTIEHYLDVNIPTVDPLTLPITPWKVEKNDPCAPITGYDEKVSFWTSFDHVADLPPSLTLTELNRVRMYAYLDRISATKYGSRTVHIATLRHCPFVQTLLRTLDYQKHWNCTLTRDAPNQATVQLQFQSNCLGQSSSKSGYKWPSGWYMMVVRMNRFEKGVYSYLDRKGYDFVMSHDTTLMTIPDQVHPVIEYLHLIEPGVV